MSCRLQDVSKHDLLFWNPNCRPCGIPLDLSCCSKRGLSSSSSIFARVDVRVIPLKLLGLVGSLPFPLWRGMISPAFSEEGMSDRRTQLFRRRSKSLRPVVPRCSKWSGEMLSGPLALSFLRELMAFSRSCKVNCSCSRGTVEPFCFVGGDSDARLSASRM